MSEKRMQQIEQRIEGIKRALLEIGPMRPGSLTRQYKDPKLIFYTIISEAAQFQ